MGIEEEETMPQTPREKLNKAAQEAGPEAEEQEEAQEPGAAEAPEEAHQEPAGPFEGASVEELEEELNRRSAEGAAVSSDGSPLQEAPAAEIEAAISKIQTAQGAAEHMEDETE
jgi:hypothetical protein